MVKRRVDTESSAGIAPVGAAENGRGEVVTAETTVARETSSALDAVVQAIQERNPDKDSDEVYADITRAVAEVRRERYAREQRTVESR